MEKLLRHFGQIAPIIVDSENVIIDGHAVWETLQALGYDEISAVIVSGRSDPEIRALRLALNCLPQDAGWDDEKLRKEFQALVELSFDLDLTAFSAVEIDFVMEIEGTGEAANAEPEAPAPEPFAVSCPGDIWTCGDHRIGCGDALNEAFIATLLAGTQPPMAFIDPPYNVPIDGFVSGNGQTRHREFLQASGEMSEGQFISFLSGGLRALKGVLSKGGLVCPKAGPCAQSAGLPVPDGSRRASIHRGDQQCGRVYPKRADDGPTRGPLALADWPQG